MNFIKEGIEKLDTGDKLPQNIKDKIPGEDKRGKSQGEHLTQKRGKDAGGGKDGGGFPNGLRPERWESPAAQNRSLPKN